MDFRFGFQGMIPDLARWLSWLERRPVTAEVVGSSPIRVANSFLGLAWQLCSEDASVAQSVEQGTENPRVDGSIPSGGTTFKHGHAALFNAAAIMRI